MIQNELSFDIPNQEDASPSMGPAGFATTTANPPIRLMAVPETHMAPKVTTKPSRRGIHATDQSFVPVPIPLASAASRRMSTRLLMSLAAIALVAIVSGALIGRYFLADNGGSDQGQGRQIALNFTGPLTSDTARLTYFAKTDVLVLSAPDLPAAPEGHVYQVWLIAGDKPAPVGTMGPDGYATVADISKYDALAITIEPGPIGSDTPTTTPFVTAPLNTASTTA